MTNLPYRLPEERPKSKKAKTTKGYQRLPITHCRCGRKWSIQVCRRNYPIERRTGTSLTEEFFDDLQELIKKRRWKYLWYLFFERDTL